MSEPAQNNQNVSGSIGMSMASLLDPRPMARIYNAERSNANFARQQQMTDTSLGSQPPYESLFSYNEYRSASGRDTSQTKPKPISVVPPPTPLPPPPPTYNGDEQSLRKLLIAMPTANSQRQEHSLR